MLEEDGYKGNIITSWLSVLMVKNYVIKLFDYMEFKLWKEKKVVDSYREWSRQIDNNRTRDSFEILLVKF